MDDSAQSNFIPEETVVVPTGNSPATPPVNSPASNTPPVSAVSAGKPKSRNRGKIVATIFGILLLVGAVSVGVKLASTNQQVANHAATPSCPSGWTYSTSYDS